MRAQAVERTGLLFVLDGAVFYGMIALIALTAIPYGTVEPWSEALFETAVFALGLLWVIHGLLAGSWKLGNVRVFLPLIALTLLAVAQSARLGQTNWAGNRVWYALSADPFESWLFALRMAALTLAGLLLVRFTSSLSRLVVLVHSVVMLGVISALFGIARETFQHSQGFMLPFLNPGVGYAQFINKNHFGFLVEMVVGLLIGMAILGQRRERFLLYLSGILLLWTAQVLSKSRGALLAMTVQLILTALLFLKSRKDETAGQSGRLGAWTRSLAITAVMIIVLIVVTVAGVGWLGGDQLATGVETASVEISNDAAWTHEGARRRDIWRATWLMFRDHPFLGSGLGGYWATIPVYHEASGLQTPQQAHNDYLELLASGGLIGAALLGWFGLAIVTQVRKSLALDEGFQRTAVLGALIGLAGVAIHSTVDFGLHITINALVAVVLLAILSLGELSNGRTIHE